ncbi:MAG TPA: RNA 2',3'-cyclic phosphodiesterase [Thermoanaerobaculia bacterium]|nr:RNA 2',3'-cyclic phosphodiesterase [Thermoanaerobaculia bacterium]
MRAFLAVPADPAWIAAAGPLAARLRRDLPRASWTRPEAWHLTLKFLGEIPESDAERFAAELAPHAAAAASGSLPPGGPLVLPPRGRPRVLAAGFAPSAAGGALEELARHAEDAAARIGVAPEGRPFRPHVTLARIRDPWPAAAVDAFRSALGEAPLPPFRCDECVLYASRLSPSGAVHTPVRTLAFVSHAEVGA